MEQTERIFIGETERPDELFDSVDLKPKKLKIGEIFQIKNGGQMLSCVRCMEEFEYYTEFTLHIENHYLRDEVPKLDAIKDETNIQFDAQAAMEDENELVIKIEPISELTIDKNDDSIHYSDDGYEQLEDHAKNTQLNSEPTFIEGEHYEKTDSNHFHCSTCKYETKQWYEMKNHLLTHFGEKNVYCPLCLKAFINVPYVRKHLDRGHKLKYTSDQIKDAQKHLNVNAITVQKRKKEEKLKILNFLKDNVKPAAKADRKKKTQKSDNRTIRTTSINKDTETPSKSFKCLICDKGFTLAKSVQRHIAIEHNQKCKVSQIIEMNKVKSDITEKITLPADETVNISENIETPQNNTEPVATPAFDVLKLFKCSECNKEIGSIRGLKRHMQRHDEKKYSCPQCDRKFVIRTYVREHMILVHGLTKDQFSYDMIPEVLNAPKATEYECYLCHRVYQADYRLIAHMSVHRMEPVYCRFCGKMFKCTEQLSKHLQRHKTNTNIPHKCDICNKLFASKRSMLGHKREKHNANRRRRQCLICSVCGWSFSHRNNFTKHLETHTNNKTKCEICQKFISVRYIQEHMQIHSDDKCFQCATCGKQFINKKRLQQHMRVHEDELKHKCDICSRAFRRSVIFFHIYSKKHEFKNLFNDIYIICLG